MPRRGAASGCRPRTRRRGSAPRCAAPARRGAARGTAPRCWPGTAAGRGRTGSPRRAPGGRARSTAWMYGRATSRSAAIVVSRFTNSSACSSATGATSAAVAPSVCTNRAQVRVCGRQVARHRDDVAQQRAERGDRLVDRDAAAGERVAEAVEVRGHRLARVVVEHVRELVELDRRGRGGADRHRVAVGELVVGAPGRQLDVLEAERRLGADQQLRVLGQRPGVTLELEREHGDAGAVLAAARLDLVDGADARAADPHLVAAHQVRRRWGPRP